MLIHATLLRGYWLLLAALFLTIAPAWAQAPGAAPIKRWDKVFGGNGDDEAYLMQQTADGGYILAGSSASGISGDKTAAAYGGSFDYWLVKLDAQGNKQWDRTYGGSRNDVLISAQQTSDGGYILAGSSTSPASFDKSQPLVSSALGYYALDYWLVKVDAQGNKQWDRDFGATCTAWLRSVQQTADGGYIVGGYLGTVFCAPLAPGGPPSDQSGPSRGDDDYWVIKLDAQGTKQWDRTLGGSAGDRLYCVRQTTDGGYLLGGTSESAASGDKSANSLSSDYWVVKLNAQGIKQWDKAYGGSGPEDLRDLCLTSDGGYLLGGSSTSGVSGTKTQPQIGGTDFWVVKIDAQGTQQWDKTLGTTNAEGITCVRQTPDGSYLLGGNLYSNPGQVYYWSGHNDYYVIKLQPNGTQQWSGVYGGPDEERLTSLQQTSDGGYLLGGYTESAMSCDRTEPLRGGNDYWAIRLYPEGVVSQPPTRITGDTLLCNSGQTQLTAAPPATATAYRWNTGATTRAITVTQPGLYSVVATLCTGATSTGQQQVTTVAATAAISGDTLLCSGSTLTLRAVAPGATAYRWSTGATTPTIAVTQPGTYSLEATYGGACTATAQLLVRGATLRLSGSTTACATGGAVLTAVAPGAATYRWSTGATSSAITLAQAGTYSVVATFPGGCTLTASQVVGAPTVALSGDSLLCAGQSGQLTATSAGAVAYRWSTGATTPTIAVTQPGTYSVQVAFASACTASAQWRVRALPGLPPFVLGRDTTLCEGESLLLRAPVPGSSGVAYAYRWSDNSTASTLRVQQPGIYSLQLTGPCNQRTASLSVAFTPCVVIPNIVTPNGDAHNDRWVVQGLAPGSYSVEVYNRWGQRVYASPAYHNDWGEQAAPGTYYYLVRQPTLGRSYKGWLEVVR